MVHGVQNGQPVAASNLPHAGSVPLYTLFFQGSGVSVHFFFTARSKSFVLSIQRCRWHTHRAATCCRARRIAFSMRRRSTCPARVRGRQAEAAGHRLALFAALFLMILCTIVLLVLCSFLSVPGTDTVRCSPARGLRAREREGEVEPTPNSVHYTERLPPATAPPPPFHF